MGQEDGAVALGGLIGPHAPNSRHSSTGAALLMDCGVRPGIYCSDPDLPCRQHACFLWHRAWAGGGGIASAHLS